MSGRIIAVLASLVILGACAKPKDLEFIDVQHIRMIKWGFSESLVGVEVRFYNPNKQRVRLKDANAKVYANSTFLGDTYMDSTIVVPRKDTFSVPLYMKVKTMSAIGKVMESLTDSTVTVKVEGHIKMGKGGVYISYPIHYEHKQSLSDLNLGF